MKDDMKNLPKGLIEASREAMKGATERSIVERQDLDEKLHGDQYKLDLNRNGKLDKHDFKLARKKKQVDEILGRGANKASLVEVFAPGINDLHEAIGEMVRFDRLKKVATVVIEGKTYKIKQSQYKAVTEAMLDELSIKTLTNYSSKINSKIGKSDDLAHKYSQVADTLDNHGKGDSKEYDDAYSNAVAHDQQASNKRSMKTLAQAKIKEKEAKNLRASARSNNFTGIKIREEVEQIDEVSKDTASSYVKKAKVQVADTFKGRGRKSAGTLKLRAKREDGIKKAEAIVAKHRAAEYEKYKATRAQNHKDLSDHFENVHGGILAKHGYSLANSGMHDPNRSGDNAHDHIRTYVKHHPNGHSTMISVNKRGDGDGHYSNHTHEVRAINTKGTSWSSHHIGTSHFGDPDMEHEKKKAEVDFHEHVKRVSEGGESKGNW